MTTDDLIMKSPVFNAAAKGVVDLGKNRVDFDVGVQPLGTIDFILSKIPIFGYVITGKEKSILVYHFKMDGTLLEPDVRYVPMKNLGTSTIGFFKRLFFTPHRLFKNASRIVKDLSEQGAPFTEKELKEFMGSEF